MNVADFAIVVSDLLDLTVFCIDPRLIYQACGQLGVSFSLPTCGPQTRCFLIMELGAF